jgi:WS/DGAT/MGAT family acyltransferase
VVRPHRLTGFDAGFLYQETRTAHMHTLKVAVLDPATVPGGYSFGLVRDVLSSRLHLLPPFTRRIVPVPLGLHHPVWVEDPEFDLDNHLFRLGLPAPGGPRELGDVISMVASHPLDRSRPLWEIHVVEGLERGRVACVAKVHHALADGVSSAEMLMAVMGSDAAPDVGGGGRPRGQALPGKAELMASALVDLVRLLVTFPGQVRRTTGRLKEMRRRSQEAEVAAPRPFSGPRTPFNRALSSDRIFAFTSLDLGEAKAIKAATGTTLNDVVMALCAGAVRSWLAGRGEPVDAPLVAGVPMSTRTPEQQGTYGNRVSNMFTSLPVHLADPVARLHAVSAVNRTAKAQADALGRDSWEALTEYTPPPVMTLYARLLGRLKVGDRSRSPINLVISNVPGPATPLSIVGAQLEAIYSVGPILEGVALNITMWSYLGRMNFGLLSCRRLMPDLWDLADVLPDALSELAKATGARAS